MSEGQPELPGRNKFVENLKVEKRYADAILTAWSAIEALMNGVILREYHLSSADHRADHLFDLDFEEKLNLQTKGNLLTEGEAKTVRLFQERRNRLFHADGVWFTGIAESEKIELTELGIDALQIIEGLQIRSMKEETWRWDKRSFAQRQKRNREDSQHP
jgi:hypothetical protein